MESNGSDLSELDSCKFVVLDSQEESPFPASGERTLLTNLPGLRMERAGSSKTKPEDVTSSKDPEKGVTEGYVSSDDEEVEPQTRAAVIHVTDTGSEAEPGLIPPSQRPPLAVADTETQSDTDGGLASDVVGGFTSSEPGPHRATSSDDPDRTIQAAGVVDVSVVEKTLPGDPDSSGLSSGKYRLGSGFECELSHTQSPHLTSKPRPSTSGVKTQDPKPAHSPKDLFAAQDSDEEDKVTVLTPSEHIASLQPSQPQALVPETLDGQSQSEVPPSMDAYGSYPVIIPSSPTDHSSGKDSSVDDPESYNPEELSTFDPNKRLKSSAKESNSGSRSSSRSGKQSTDSDNKSNSSSVKQWQPTTLLSDVESQGHQPTVSTGRSIDRSKSGTKSHRQKFDIDLELSEQLQRSSASKFFPSASEGNTETRDSLALRFSNTDEDKSNSAHLPQEESPPEGHMDVDEPEYLDSQHISLHLTQSQPDSAGKYGQSDNKTASQTYKSTSQPYKRTDDWKTSKPRQLSSSDPLSDGGKRKFQGVVSLFGPRPPGGADVDVSSPQKPLSSTPEDKVEEEAAESQSVAPVLKPSLSLSMIDLHDEEEDSSIQSFKLTRPVVHVPDTSVVTEGESLFKKGVSPQKKRKRTVYEECTDDDPFSFTPKSRTKSKPKKPSPAHSSVEGVGTWERSSEGEEPKGGGVGGVTDQAEQKDTPTEAVVVVEEEDLDITIPPENSSLKDQTKSAETSINQSETATSEGKTVQTASHLGPSEQDTILYDVDTYTEIKQKPAERAVKSLISVDSPIPDSATMSQSQASIKHQSKQSPDSAGVYDFPSSQSQAVGGAIKDPNTTPVVMPKSAGKVGTGKKRRKMATSTRQTRARAGTTESKDKSGANQSLSSSEDVEKTPASENVGFMEHSTTVRRNTRARKGQGVKKKVRLSVGGETEQPGPSTSTAVTPTQPLGNVSDLGSAPAVRWKKIVTTKTRFLYVTRHITIEERKEGRVVYSETKEENDEPILERKSVTTQEEEEFVSPGPSPSRSVSTVTSGDLGDVSSSLSRSGSHTSKTSSGGSLERMHSSLERMALSGNAPREEPGHAAAGVKHPGSGEEQKTPNPPGAESAVAGHTEESTVKSRLSRDGSDVLFTSSDMDKSDSSKHGTKDLDASHVELSPILDEDPPPVMIPKKQAADSSDDNRISGGKTQNVIVVSEISSSSMGDKQVSGGFSVTEQGISPDGERSESDYTMDSHKRKTATKSKQLKSSSSYHSSSSGKDLPLKKRKVIHPGEGSSPKKAGSPRKGKVKPDSSSTSDDISPEIPLQGPLEPDVLGPSKVCQRLTTQTVDTHTGSPVMAKWRDGYYYPGILIGPKPNDKCMVDFTDGDHLSVRVGDVIIVDRFSIGQSVLVESSDGGFDPGLVIGYYGRGANMGYTVETDDAATKKYSRNKVILSADQAACILGDGPAPATPGPSHAGSAADVSLDNLVEGKRRSRRAPVPDVKSSKVASASKRSRSSAGTKTPGSSKDSASNVKKRKIHVPAFEPSKTSTPTPTQSGRKASRTVATPKKIGGAVDSPQAVSRVSRRVRLGLFDDAKGPIPTDNTLFRGVLFMLTHVDRTPEQRREERLLLIESSFEGSTDESAIEDEVVVPFDKEHLKAQIEAGGGRILDKFDITQVSAAQECYLISDCYQRTVKYLHCLAAGVTCLSHVWIRDSCKQGKLLDPASYVLPAGLNIESRKIMECCRRNSLAGLAVCVVSLSQEFRDAWVSILQTSGCVVTSQLSSEVTVDKDLGAVVTDSSCPQSFIKKSQKANVPVVSTEWVIQCLIRGEFVDTSSHPRYRPHHTET